MKHVAVAVVLLVFFASGCAHSKRSDLRSTDDVMSALREAHLDPARVTLTISSSIKQPDTDAFGFSEAVLETDPNMLMPVATLEADQRRAIVYVYPTREAAAAMSGFYGNSVRARNVVVVPLGAHVSRRMRDAVFRLR